MTGSLSALESVALRQPAGATARVWHVVLLGSEIATNPLGFYDQSTPKAALRSFIRAYRLERWDIMLRFVPSSYR